MFQPVIMCFSPYLDIGHPGGGGSPQALRHGLLMQFSTQGGYKIEVSATYSF